MAGIEALLGDLNEEATCMVCSEIFTDPRHLPCLHSFCLECLKRWYQTRQNTNNGTIECPKCRSISNVPASGDLEALPTSFYQNALADVLAIKECTKSKVTCANCDEKCFSSEASYCFQCCIFYCKDCVTAHRTLRKYKNHRALAVSDFKAEDYEDLLKRPSFCPKQQHQNEELKYYCKNCKKVVCQTCSSLEHSGHDLKLIEEEINKVKGEIETLVKTQKQNLQAKKLVIGMIDEESDNVIQHGKAMNANVEIFAKNLTSAIEANKEQVFASVEEKTKKSLESLAAKRSELEQDAKAIESSLERANKLIVRSTNAELIQLKIALETMLKNVGPIELSALHPDDVRSLAFEKNEKLQNTVDGEGIGFLTKRTQTKAGLSTAEGQGLMEGLAGHEAQFMLTTRNLQGKQCYHERDRVTMEIRKRGRVCPTAHVRGRITDWKNGQYQIAYYPVTQGRYSIIVKVNEEQIRDSPFIVTVKASEQVISSRNPLTRGNQSPGAPPYVSQAQGTCSRATSEKSFQFTPLCSFGAKDSPRALETMSTNVCPIESVALHPDNVRSLAFEKNEKLQNTVDGEGIGFLTTRTQTKAGLSTAEGQGLMEGLAGHEAQFIVTTRNLQGRQCYHERDRVTMEIRKRGRVCPTAHVRRITDCRNGQYQIAYYPVTKGRYSIIVKVNEEQICDSPFTVIVKASEQVISSRTPLIRGNQSPSAPPYVSPQAQGACSRATSETSFQFTPLFSFGAEDSPRGNFQRPCGVAVNDTDKIAVTEQLGHRVQIFYSSGKFLRSFGCRGNSDGEFKFPYGICFDHSRNIFVADRDNNRIQIFNERGKYKGMFGREESPADSLLNSPCGLSMDSNGNVIVADSGHRLIKIFSSAGKFLRRIGAPGCFIYPFHCVQYNTSFIVSDKIAHCIKVFDQTGKFQFQFGKRGERDGEFNSPSYLSVTKTGHLMVCDSGNHRVQVFELRGNIQTFLCKFGTKGSKLGEFNEPQSVAVLSNGNTVVSDWWNHRVQIFR